MSKRNPRTYGRNDIEEKESQCIEAVLIPGLTFAEYRQCSRKRGHGIGGFYCKVHDPAQVKAREDERQRAYEERSKYEMERFLAPRKLAIAVDALERIKSNTSHAKSGALKVLGGIAAQALSDMRKA